MSSLLMLLVATLYSALAHAAIPTASFDIPAGDARKTLQQFITQTGIEMLYSADDVADIETHAISGQLNIAEALRRMVAGTELQVSFEGDYTFALVKRVERAQGPETPEGLTETQTPVYERAHAYLPARAFAREPELQEVVVTGTLIHGVLDIVSPLQFITRNDMNRSSYATLQDALDSLPVNMGGGASEDVGSAGNFGRGVSANLRGLGSGATLVLVDGRRQAFSGSLADFVDISSIPWSAVERVEVLPDGASALYGSDAIAGVVNVIMRKDLSGGETWARLGSAPGGADEKLIAQLFGTTWQTGRALFTYQYSERSSLAAAEREYSASTDKRPFGGTDLRSVLSTPGNILDPHTLQPSHGIPSVADGHQPTVADLLPGQINLQNRNATVDLLPNRYSHNLFASASQKLGERLELVTEGRYSHRKIDQQIFPFEQELVVPATHPFAANPYPDIPFVLIGYSFLDVLGPMWAEAATQTLSGGLSLKALLTDTWRLTFSGSYGRERLRAETHNIASQPALNAALQATDPNLLFNPFGGRVSNNPEIIESIRTTQFDYAISAVESGAIVADGKVISMASGDAKIALGAEWRQEQFGNVLGNGMPFDRTVKSGFAELSVPIVGDAEDPRAVPRLELSLAGRYESYSDFGSAWNPKIGLRWAPSGSLKLRGSWGTSFRAPRLTDLFDTTHNLTAVSSSKDPRSPTGSSAVLVSFTNNPDLKEETATTWTAGLDVTFSTFPGSLSLTYYNIDYIDRIVVPSIASSPDVLLYEDQWASIIKRQPSQADIDAICSSPFFIGAAGQCTVAAVAAIVDFRPRNLAATRVEGFDVRFEETLETSFHGAFQFGITAGYILGFDQALSDTSEMIDIVDTVGNPPSVRVHGTAEWFQHGWDRPGFGLHLTIDHVGASRDTESALSRTVADATIFDFQVSYRTAAGAGPFADAEFMLNASNLFNRDPPFVNREAGYDTRNAQPYGRVVSLSVQKTW